MLITVEGIDGAGKSTLVAGLADALRAHDPVVLREPGGVELAERLRALVKDPALTVGARAEALVYAAARAQLVDERLRPLLDAGRLVLLDRVVRAQRVRQPGDERALARPVDPLDRDQHGREARTSRPPAPARLQRCRRAAARCGPGWS